MSSLRCWAFVWLNDCANGDEADFTFVQTQKTQSLYYRFVSFRVANSTMQLRIIESQKVQNGGILQIYNGVNKWGYICSYGWDISDANAACKQLGYSKAAAAFEVALIEEDIQIAEWFLNHVTCQSSYNPPSLMDCGFSGFDACSCVTNRMAGVQCTQGKFINTACIFNKYNILQFTFRTRASWIKLGKKLDLEL